MDYDSWPFARHMAAALDRGQIRVWCLGLGVDPLTYATDLLPVAVIDSRLFDELVPFLILSLAALGLNLLVGYCGQLSLGTGGFMAVGAYAAYNLCIRIPSLNPLVAFLLAGGVATAPRRRPRVHPRFRAPRGHAPTPRPQRRGRRWTRRPSASCR